MFGWWKSRKDRRLPRPASDRAEQEFLGVRRELLAATGKLKATLITTERRIDQRLQKG